MPPRSVRSSYTRTSHLARGSGRRPETKTVEVLLRPLHVIDNLDLGRDRAEIRGTLIGILSQMNSDS